MPQRGAQSPDVVVVGGGVIGLAVAWRAALGGARVSVLERGDPGGGTSRVAAGMLAPTAEADPLAPHLLELGLQSARDYPAFVRELEAVSGQDPGYLRCGTLVVARDRDQAEALARELELRRSLELPAAPLRPSAARRLEPGLAPSLSAAFELPEDHAIDPRRLAAALVQAVRRAGSVVRTGVEVTGVLGERRVRGVALAGGEVVPAGEVVIAAGAWSAALEGISPEARVPLHPVKGQILRLHDPAGPGLLGRVLRMADGYVVPRGDGRYVIGATMEERGFDTTTTAGGVLGLLRDAIELLPGVEQLVIDELSAGLRPATADNAPVIGAAAVPGLHWATGHYRNGILLAPITAELVLASLLGEAPAELAVPFGPTRFARAADHALEASARTG